MTTDPLGTYRSQLIEGIGMWSSRRRRRRLTFAAGSVVVVGAVIIVLFGARPESNDRLVADGRSETATPSGPGEPGQADFVCPITQPDPAGFTAPDGSWPARPPSGVWYGSADLWTLLPTDGSSPTPRKSVWWSARFRGGSVEQKPDIAVTWRRLDKPVDPIRNDGPGTNAGTAEHGSFMIAGGDPPSMGCWEVTASYRGAHLSYVYWNPPRLQLLPSSDVLTVGESRIGGTLRYDDTSNCYSIERDRRRWLVIWPAQTAVSVDGTVVTLTNGRAVRAGDHIEGTGTYRTAAELSALGIPPTCESVSEEAAVFTDDATVTATPN